MNDIVSFETNLISVFQLTTNQMGLLIKLEKILSSLVKMANGFISQIKHPIMSVHVCKCNCSYN